MKKVLFDVDGVFLSEERCFDVTALSVHELLFGEAYLNLKHSMNLTTLTDLDIKYIRNEIFLDDNIINQLKSLGLNSNWDMLFIIVSTHIIEIIQKASLKNIDLNNKLFNYKRLKKWSNDIKHMEIDYKVPLKFISQTKSGKENIYEDLQEYARKQLKQEDVSIFELKSNFWNLCQEIYQEWYLGYELYEKIENKIAKTDFKKGYLEEEVMLVNEKEAYKLLSDLKGAGYEIGIATGRSRAETLIPFKSLGLLKQFEEHYIGTATEVLESEAKYPEHKPLGKPNPFSYMIACYGNDVNHYLDYITNQESVFKNDEIFIVGDSLADLLSAKKTKATFIGTLTGLKGQMAKAELETYGADFIVDNVLDIRKILIK